MNNERCTTMNINRETFSNLVELYPETAKNLQLRALEKRSIFMYYKQKSQIRGKKAVAKFTRKLTKVARREADRQKLFDRQGKKEETHLRSTYFGPKNDSDDDEFHITMPFKWDEDRHLDILDSLKFEPDEEF